jgi:starvation-inducible DNA-binding protein
MEEIMARQAATQIQPQRTDSVQATIDLSHSAVEEICAGLRPLLADVFGLYLKTKNFHWHMSGPHFRDYHRLLDEQAEQIFAMTDDIAERARKLGGTTLHSISDITRHQRLHDNNAETVSPTDHADRSPRRQQAARERAASYARSLRPERRCCHCQPD